MIKTWYKRCFAFIVAIMLCLAFFPVSKANAETDSIYVDDGADLFTDVEEAVLAQKIDKIRGKYDADVVILTLDQSGMSDYQQVHYMEDYFDSNYDMGTIKHNTTILLINKPCRYVGIQGYGNCEQFISNDRIESILDDIESDLHYNEYYDACCTALNRISHYYGTNPNPLTWTWLHAIIALAIGIIVTLVMVANTKGKITTSSRTYLDQQHSGLVAKRDMYLTTTVRKVHIQQSSGGSGGHSSGGGRSSGGHSHSGGGRHF